MPIVTTRSHILLSLVVVTTVAAGFGAGLGLKLLRAADAAGASGLLDPPSFTNGNVNIQNFSFDPTPVVINPGDKVTWHWLNGTHSVVFSDGPSSGPPTSNTNTVYERTFSQAGNYDYVCGQHSFMQARVTVIPFMANASISGHVSGPQGQALAGVTVSIRYPNNSRRRVRANQSGDYVISNVPTGSSYDVVPRSRVYVFSSQNITLNDNVTGINFTGMTPAGKPTEPQRMRGAN